MIISSNNPDWRLHPDPYSQGAGTHYSFSRKLVRGILLALAGYVIYFGAIYSIAQMDASITPSEANLTWGSIVSFAFASSEFFAMKTWSLKDSLTRRLIVSTTITILSLILSAPIAQLAGIELRRERTPLFLPRLAIGLPCYIVFSMAFLFLLNRKRCQGPLSSTTKGS